MSVKYWGCALSEEKHGTRQVVVALLRKGSLSRVKDNVQMRKRLTMEQPTVKQPRSGQNK